MDDRPHMNGVTTLERVQNREEFRNLITDVGHLPETQRTALLLREMDAMSYEEIAQAMDQTVPGVKCLLVRARIALAESSQARQLTCDEVRLELAEAAEGLAARPARSAATSRSASPARTSAPSFAPTRKALAAIFPAGGLLALKGLVIGKLSGIFGGGAAGGTAGTGAAGGAASAGAASAGGAAASGAGAIAGGAAAAGGARRSQRRHRRGRGRASAPRPRPAWRPQHFSPPARSRSSRPPSPASPSPKPETAEPNAKAAARRGRCAPQCPPPRSPPLRSRRSPWSPRRSPDRSGCGRRVERPAQGPPPRRRASPTRTAPAAASRRRTAAPPAAPSRTASRPSATATATASPTARTRRARRRPDGTPARRGVPTPSGRARRPRSPPTQCRHQADHLEAPRQALGGEGVGLLAADAEQLPVVLLGPGRVDDAVGDRESPSRACPGSPSRLRSSSVTWSSRKRTPKAMWRCSSRATLEKPSTNPGRVPSRSL